MISGWVQVGSGGFGWVRMVSGGFMFYQLPCFSPHLRRLPWHRGSFLCEYFQMSIQRFEGRKDPLSLSFRHFVFLKDGKMLGHQPLLNNAIGESRKCRK